MRAWVLTKPAPIEERPLQLVERPRPQPLGSEVRVRVSLCGICRTDLHIAEGELPVGKERLVLGHEIVGVVDAVGADVSRVRPGEKVGVTWLGRTCGVCKHCRAGRENYCAAFKATGRDLDGGFAEYAVAHEDAIFALEGIRDPDEQIAPMLCAGVAGYCAFRLMDVGGGDRVGLYGFGPTAYYVLKVADHLGIEVYVSSRSELNLERARRHGAVWVGNAAEDPLPVELDAAIVFPPAGQLVELALQRVKPGGVLVLAPVAMSTIEIGQYSANLWGRDIRTLYNVNRRDAEEFLRLAEEIDMSLGTEVFPFDMCQEGMMRVRRGAIREANAAVRV
ncbi:MAG: alcohol dehydrogenase catalytic domain-containing protein [Gemmatimonadales bacterium]|jgi:propanol-preferring alcohol dehydrogenase